MTRPSLPPERERLHARMGPALRVGLKALAAAMVIAYPLLVYAWLGHMPPYWLASLLLLASSLRLIWRRDLPTKATCGVAALVVIWSVLSPDGVALRSYPVLINALMLTIFATSLRRGPSIVERLARIQEPDLPPEAIAYTRKVTQVWCGFFIANGAMAAATAIWANTAVWALYNGLIAYALMGTLGAGEWLIRQRVRRRPKPSHPAHQTTVT